MKRLIFLPMILLFLSTLLFTSTAWAGNLCVNIEPPVISNSVTPNLGCEVGNGNDSLAQVNADAMFGETWSSQFYKEDFAPPGGGGPAVTISFTTNYTAGSLSFSDSFFSGGMKVMAVFKDGNSDNVGNNYIGYLLNPSACVAGVCTYNFTSPHLNADGSLKNTSHISLYKTEGTVPEPTVLVLMGIGLLGVGALKRRLH